MSHSKVQTADIRTMSYIKRCLHQYFKWQASTASRGNHRQGCPLVSSTRPQKTGQKPQKARLFSHWDSQFPWLLSVSLGSAKTSQHKGSLWTLNLTYKRNWSSDETEKLKCCVLATGVCKLKIPLAAKTKCCLAKNLYKLHQTYLATEYPVTFFCPDPSNLWRVHLYWYNPSPLCGQGKATLTSNWSLLYGSLLFDCTVAYDEDEKGEYSLYNSLRVINLSIRRNCVKLFYSLSNFSLIVLVSYSNICEIIASLQWRNLLHLHCIKTT